MNRRDFIRSAGLGGAAFAAGGSAALSTPVPAHDFRTRHVIWIINGNGSRKRDWYERFDLSPNFARLAREGFVYEESHNGTVSSHADSWTELMTGNRRPSGGGANPTPLHYLRKAYADHATNYWFVNGISRYRRWQRPIAGFFANGPDYGANTRPVLLTMSAVFRSESKRTTPRIVDDQFAGIELRADEKRKLEQFIDAARKEKWWESGLRHIPIPREPFESDAAALALVPAILKEFKPRMIVCHLVGHDAGHGNGGYPRLQTGYFEYEKVCRTTDEQVGSLLDFVKSDPYFSRHTAIVVRPEVGRDDEITMYGELHHSEGYYQSVRSAEIWWGPDFRPGVERGVRNRMDVVPSLTRLFNVHSGRAAGRVHAEMFKDSAVRNALQSGFL